MTRTTCPGPPTGHGAPVHGGGPTVPHVAEVSHLHSGDAVLPATEDVPVLRMRAMGRMAREAPRPRFAVPHVRGRVVAGDGLRARHRVGEP